MYILGGRGKDLNEIYKYETSEDKGIIQAHHRLAVPQVE
jgi:hypothetical protein